jgi:hypothetical protein
MDNSRKSKRRNLYFNTTAFITCQAGGFVRKNKVPILFSTPCRRSMHSIFNKLAEQIGFMAFIHNCINKVSLHVKA